MSNHLYDIAYGLERALRQNEDFLKLKDMYNQVLADQNANALFKNFRDIQLKLQQKQMTGQEITSDEVQQAQKAAALAQQNEKIAKLIETEQRMSFIIDDLNKIIMKPLDELYGNIQY
jgi:cell fate (sporulation/competence/biofilm development) regulator YlbF (YheA/YmcA/DUF963 family)